MLTVSRGHEEGLKYPDFIISRPIPMPHGQPHVKHILALVEIKNTKNDIREDPRRCIDAIVKVVDHYRLLSRTSSASQFPPRQAYLVYGPMYTILRSVDCQGVLVFEEEPWQPVFQDPNPDAGTVPFAYKLCELAVNYWN